MPAAPGTERGRGQHVGPVARQGSERHRGLRPGGCGRAPRLSVSCVCLKVTPGPPAGPWPRGRAGCSRCWRGQRRRLRTRSSGSGHRREVSPSPRLGRLPKSRCSRVWRGEAELPPLATRSGRRPRTPAGKRGPRERRGARRQGPAGTGPDQVARAACWGQVREGGGDGRT